MKSRRYFYEFAVVSLIVLLICSILLIPKKGVYANTDFSENEVNELNEPQKKLFLIKRFLHIIMKKLKYRV